MSGTEAAAPASDTRAPRRPPPHTVKEADELVEEAYMEVRCVYDERQYVMARLKTLDAVIEKRRGKVSADLEARRLDVLDHIRSLELERRLREDDLRAAMKTRKNMLVGRCPEQ